jgi:hypothetical protein
VNLGQKLSVLILFPCFRIPLKYEIEHFNLKKMLRCLGNWKAANTAGKFKTDRSSIFREKEIPAL